jgi:hypothetical protein
MFDVRRLGSATHSTPRRVLLTIIISGELESEHHGIVRSRAVERVQRCTPIVIPVQLYIVRLRLFFFGMEGFTLVT